MGMWALPTYPSVFSTSGVCPAGHTPLVFICSYYALCTHSTNAHHFPNTQ